jgi:hypothetical protein
MPEGACDVSLTPSPHRDGMGTRSRYGRSGSAVGELRRGSGLAEIVTAVTHTSGPGRAMRTPEAVATTGRKVSPTGSFLPLNLRRGG